MRKLFFSLVILSSLVFLWFKADFGARVDERLSISEPDPVEILSFAIVSDSENDNENLKKALSLAKDNNAGFVIGLGDWTPLGIQPDLKRARFEFDQSGLEYYVTAGDRDLWSGRNDGNTYSYFDSVFGKSTHVINKGEVSMIIIDNADLYQGISEVDWEILSSALSSDKKLKLVFSHKAPYHPQTAHIMGSERESVARQADQYIGLLEEKKIGGFFSGDIHFYAKFNSPNSVFKMNTIGSVNRERNFQGPSFAIVKVYSDYTWDSESIDLQ